jgi:predicted AlkP superfamily pyrophosphatase or phosphodiesterase
MDQDSLVEVLDAHPQVDAYTKEDIPDRFHIADHRRTPPIMAVADEGWTFSTRERYVENPARYNGGSHGYDNALESMGGIFIARGPSFRRGATVGPFESIHIYEMVCRILGLEPAANDGNLNAVADILAFTSADAQP